MLNASLRIRGAAWLALLVVVTLTPLVFSLYGSDVFRLPKEVFFQAGMLVVGVLTLLAWSLEPWPVRIGYAEVGIAAGAVGWCALVAKTAVVPVVSLFAPFSVFCYALLFVTTLLLLNGNQLLALGALLAPAVVNAIVVMLQATRVWTPFPEIPTGPEKLANIGILGNPNYVGSYLLIPCVAAIAGTLATAGRRRLLFAVTGVVLLAGLLAAQSVTAAIALGAGVLAFTVTSGSRVLRLGVVAAVVALLCITLAWRPTRERISDLMASATRGQWVELSSERIPPFGVAWKMFEEHPITGVGPGVFSTKYMSYKVALEETHPSWLHHAVTNYGEVHNDHLQLLAEGGAIAWLLFAALLVLVARQSWRSDDPFVRQFAFPSAVAFAVLALAQFPLQLTASASAAIFAAAICLHRAGGEAPRRMRMLLPVAVLACVVAVLAIQRLCLARYHCNVEKKTLETRLNAAFDLPSEWQQRDVGRDVAARLARCLDVDPTDYVGWFLQGQAYQAAGQNESAMRSYQTSLALSERPETLANIAVLQFEAGNPAAAYKSLLDASLFSLKYAWTTDENLRVKLHEEVNAREKRIRETFSGNSGALQ